MRLLDYALGFWIVKEGATLICFYLIILRILTVNYMTKDELALVPKDEKEKELSRLRAILPSWKERRDEQIRWVEELEATIVAYEQSLSSIADL
jgi:hypothetical protein